jgi:PHS family inorganic phosphate transporter-like MFS transporter
MGYLGDVLGRSRALTLTLALASVAALFSAIAPTGSPTAVYITIIVFRFILGVGLGGVYPLSATKVRDCISMMC